MQVPHKWQQPSAHQTHLKLFTSIMLKFEMFLEKTLKLFKRLSSINSTAQLKGMLTIIQPYLS